jgi:hypothetical protein
MRRRSQGVGSSASSRAMIRAARGSAGVRAALGDTVRLVDRTDGRSCGLLRQREPRVLIEAFVDGHPAEAAVGVGFERPIEQFAPELGDRCKVDPVYVCERPPEPVTGVGGRLVACSDQDVGDPGDLEARQPPQNTV